MRWPAITYAACLILGITLPLAMLYVRDISSLPWMTKGRQVFAKDLAFWVALAITALLYVIVGVWIVIEWLYKRARTFSSSGSERR